MFARLSRVMWVCALALVPCAVRAEDPSPEMVEMFQQVQQMRDTVMKNMQDKGIDPREFFGSMRQSMQDGTFDMQALQQKLVDQGLIEKDAIANIQTKAQSATLNTLKRQLGVTDEEWKAVQPKLQRVITAKSNVDGPGGMGGGGMGGMFAGFMRGPSAGPSEVMQKTRELSAAIADTASKPEDIQEKLTALRTAKKKAKDELADAQKDLMEMLTARQEGVLLLFGLL
ncbi:MAG TPA: hypothetical protein VKX17_03720 [Planctomycetota bacterium]|nr:hypothetical protein [Planctomycetota bacterium]